MRRVWPWLIVIVMVGIFLRLIGFGRVPVSPYWDEMAVWDDARSIIETGRDMHNRPWLQPIFISYGDFKLPVYIWLTSLSSVFFTDILPAVRFPSLLAGIATIFGTYWLACFLFDDKKGFSALAAALAAATLPWSIHFSRVAYEGHVASALVLWSVLTLWWSVRQTKVRWQWAGILLSAVLGLIAVYTYFSVRFIFPIVFLAPLVLWWPKLRSRWPQFLVGALLWLILLIPMYRADFYDASNQFRLSATNVWHDADRPNQINLWRQQSGNTFLSRVVFNQYTFLVRDLSYNYWEFLSPSYLWLSGDPNLRHGNGISGLMLATTAPFFLIGLIQLVRTKPRTALYLGLWWMVGVLPAAVPTDVPHALRSLNTLPVFVLLIGWGAEEIRQWWIAFRRRLSSSRRRLLGLMLIGVVVFGMTVELVRNEIYFVTVYPTISSKEWQDGYLPTAQYVQSVRDQYTFVYVDQFDDRFFLYYLPYSGLTFHEIQQQPSAGFKRSTFRNVIIDTIKDWETLEHNSLVVTTPGRLPEGWKIKEEVVHTAGKDRFVATETPRD